MRHPWDVIAGLLSALTILGLLGRWFHIPQTLKHLRLFLADWLGEPERDGFAGRPSFPARMSKTEDLQRETTAQVTAIGEVVDEIKTQTAETQAAVARQDFRANGVDRRITDHAKRNEETAKALREELERRAEALQTALRIRNQSLDDRLDTIDGRLDTISDDLLRGETYRAILVELGLPIERPEHPEPP